MVETEKRAECSIVDVGPNGAINVAHSSMIQHSGCAIANLLLIVCTSLFRGDEDERHHHG
jgi:hypothetical protein